MSAVPTDNPKILVVDDEKVVHDSVERILSTEGYQIDAAYKVDEAVQKLELGRYDLVLTDLMMPGRDGMEIVKLISEKYQDCGVVIFTGYATVESTVKSIKLGALDYLPKPFSPEELIEVTKRSLMKVHELNRDQAIERDYEQVAKAMTSSLDMQETLMEICKGILEVFKVKGCSVFTYDKGKQDLKLRAYAGLSEDFVSKGNLSANISIPAALESDEPLIINEDQFHSELQYPSETKAEGIVSIQSIPLKIRESVIGFLRVYCSDKCIYGKKETEYFVKFADHAAQAIKNAMSYDQLRKDVEQLKNTLSERGA